MLPVAILAGGLATRLGVVTQMIPKSLVEVAGQPFVLHQLALLRDAGVPRVVLCIAHLGEQVEAVVGDGRRFGVEVVYSNDGGQLRGTGGALAGALPLLGERFLVLYGDSYLRCDYRAIARRFVESDKRGLMTVFRNDGKYDASNVDYRDGRILRYEKGVPGMTHIDYGLGGFRADAFVGFSNVTKFDLAAVYQTLIANEDVLGYEVHERFYEIGSPAGLDETRRLLENRP